MHRRLTIAGSAALALALVGAPVGAEEAVAENEVRIDLGCDTFAVTPAVADTVDVTVGHIVSLHLCSNPTTGFSWSDPASSDAAVAAITDWKFEEPGSDALGAPGQEHITISALAEGTATITASYDQPWDGGTKGAASIAITVNVGGDATALDWTCDDIAEGEGGMLAVEVPVGTTVSVLVCSNPTTGYRWSDPASSDAAIAAIAGVEYEAPASDMAGAPGAERITISGVAAGTAEITTSYGRPWEDPSMAVQTLTIMVTVK